MKTGQSLSSLTSSLLTELEVYFKLQPPEIVLGHGDTTTCFTTALSCFYHRIPFYHVEAGLRTHLIDTPFPEEFNRQSIAPLASHHFAPTEIESQNLIKEGIHSSSITIIGSTVHEAVEFIQKKNTQNDKYLPFEIPKNRKVVTVTLHRREGIQTLENTLYGIRLAAEARTDALFICPIHPNPTVQTAFKKFLSNLENVKLIQALDYATFIKLLLNTSLVLTDSGGIQEEASLLGKRTLLARTQTERVDGIKDGLVSLVGVNSEAIFLGIQKNLDKKTTFLRPLQSQKRSSEIITDSIEKAIL